jgi:hypothetical protein
MDLVYDWFDGEKKVILAELMIFIKFNLKIK